MTTSTNEKTNGIDVGALRASIDQISQDPAAGQTRWKVRSEWQGGTRADHHVDGIEVGGQAVDRKFTLKSDEPFELCGNNEYANPQEYLLAGLNACMMVGYAAVAALMGIELEKLEVELDGDIDLRGFLAIDEKVAPGYEGLRQTVRIEADATPEQLDELHRAVQKTSPNFFNITNAIPVNSRLIVE
jgi:uncharacterized OsmC-like protein